MHVKSHTWSSYEELTSHLKFDEIELRIDSELQNFKSKHKMHVVVLVFWLKATQTMKHCVMIRRSALHESKSELEK